MCRARNVNRQLQAKMKKILGIRIKVKEILPGKRDPSHLARGNRIGSVLWKEMMILLCRGGTMMRRRKHKHGRTHSTSPQIGPVVAPACSTYGQATPSAAAPFGADLRLKALAGSPHWHRGPLGYTPSSLDLP